MAGFNFNAIGTAVGGFLSGYDDAKTRAEKHKRAEMEMAEAQERQKDEQRKRQAMAGAYMQQKLGATGLGAARTIGGLQDGSDVSSAMPLPGGAMSSLPGAEQRPGGGGLAPGFARGADGGLTRDGQQPDTYIGGQGPGGGAMPAWEDKSQRGAPGFARGSDGSPVTADMQEYIDQTTKDYIASHRAGGGGQRAPSSGMPRGEIPTNNFAGMRQPGVPSGGGPMQNPGGWQRFDTPEAGVQGISRQLDRYASGATTGKPLTSLREIVSTWAPPNENKTDNLIQRASQVMGVQPDQPLDLSNPEVKAKLVEAMIRGEQGGKLPVSPEVIQRALSGGGRGGGQGTLAASAAKMPAEFHQAAQKGAQQAAADIPPDIYGRVSQNALIQRIEKAMPGADDATKFMALEYSHKLMAPSEQRQWEMFKEQHHEKMQMLLQDRQDARQQRSLDASEQRQERSIIGAEQRQEQRDKATEERQDKRLGAGRASRNVEVTDGEGKVLFSGSAHQGQGGWIADKDQQPVNVPEDANIKILGTGGQGKQAAAQIQSMIGSSSELVGEARNLMELPGTSVAGIFQGLQSVPAHEMGEALKRTLANKVTPEEQTDLTTSFQGVARSLATIEAQGRATGLVGLTGMSQGLMPQTGDTKGNVLRKMATLRQIMERNIDAIEASPNASVDQKKLLKNLKGEMAQVIPFTVSDVNKLQHGDTESMLGMAKNYGLAGGAGGDSIPVPDDLKSDPDGQSYEKDGATWVKRGDTLIKTPGAVKTP
jgi:hypothetical protein